MGGPRFDSWSHNLHLMTNYLLLYYFPVLCQPENYLNCRKNASVVLSAAFIGSFLKSIKFLTIKLGPV